ncbi:HTH-type transcriptional regulator CysL [Pseudovibrio sp. W64]|uniref:LysR family transcriptional regulator n=1 Tax=unclassified Pseudovibrio TaxID=2627060 RepID=UPI0007AE9D20|nr:MULTISPECIES: LysR family transcriptional regulator [unclassified Pseudovibrio]KZK84167.1 HTH-type transcriptional regulator CysL [Pseudovibrio sp. Ad13]KZK88697.1 HTH-type transcriptional regulator CysL [Pseudovibrio sp. W64]KZL01328.1 HTH-type transcriptional regulator CysL [Pseudovibrio sp. W74]KZL08930.1 HTH-type transcriptional regulator CysL [Pseudovibrio sp. Ad14]KZL25726.1 HTH-type transcriptional regulator CysL [Pseudovibrio sp. Ad37]
MDIHQLKTFVTVAREGSITKASELLFRSQPAVSAHIKNMEETLGLTLFQRTPRGMAVTPDGQRLLTEAHQLLDRHQKFLEEASRLRGSLAGSLTLGAGRNSSTGVVSNLLAAMSQEFPEVEVELQHRPSVKVLEGIRNGSLDAGFYTETGEDDAGLSTLEISNFCVYLAAPADLVPVAAEVNWKALESVPWIYPSGDSCCGRVARDLLDTHGIRPKRVINVDDEGVTRALIASGVGIGLVHANSTNPQENQGDIVLLSQVQKSARVLFAHLSCRKEDPVIAAVRSILATDNCTSLSFQDDRTLEAALIAS